MISDMYVGAFLTIKRLSFKWYVSNGSLHEMLDTLLQLMLYIYRFHHYIMLIEFADSYADVVFH